jgi:pimeloyl-ACP methyl ester carboxylesterase
MQTTQTLLHMVLLAALTSSGQADEPPADAVAYGPRLEGFEYAHPVQLLPLTSQRQTLEMAYLDLPPTGTPREQTVLLLHGKNYCAGTWEATIDVLRADGYRVVAPDQIGFCKSSKPANYQFTFHQLVANTVALIDELGIDKVSVVGHSMGGMLAMRLALLEPERVRRLVLVNPIGLEDWQAKGVPYQPLDAAYEAERVKDYADIKAYQQRF